MLTQTGDQCVDKDTC